MKKFSFFEHTADVLFEAHGRTLRECIENAALALFSVMAKPRLLKKTVKVRVRMKARNTDELVVFLLDRLVGESDSRLVFWKEFKVTKLAEMPKGPLAIEGTAFGSPYSVKAAATHVKAVTMHRAKIFRNPKGIWTARIVLDI